MSEPVAVLFDVDGTLVSSGGAGTAAWHWAFNELFGVPVDPGEHTAPGTTDPEVARRSFVGGMGREPEPRELARLLSAYLQRITVEVGEAERYRVLPGVEELLPRLCDAGVLVGLTTGLLEGAARAKLGRGGLNEFFCFGGYGSDSADRGDLTKRGVERAGMVLGVEIDPRDVLVIGDTPRDVAAARAAGAVAVAVATGGYSAEQLQRTGADLVLPSLEGFEP